MFNKARINSLKAMDAIEEMYYTISFIENYIEDFHELMLDAYNYAECDDDDERLNKTLEEMKSKYASILSSAEVATRL